DTGILCIQVERPELNRHPVRPRSLLEEISEESSRNLTTPIPDWRHPAILQGLRCVYGFIYRGLASVEIGPIEREWAPRQSRLCRAARPRSAGDARFFSWTRGARRQRACHALRDAGCAAGVHPGRTGRAARVQ